MATVTGDRHELRTPLTSINASIGLLSDGVMGDLTPETREMLSIARSNRTACCA